MSHNQPIQSKKRPRRYLFVGGHQYILSTYVGEMLERVLMPAVAEIAPVTAPSEPEGYLEAIV